MRTTFHDLRIAVLCALIAALLSAPHARGQSANDGFDPDVNGPIHAIAVQSDGKILIGGRLTAVAGVPRSHLARLNPDGSLDLTFTNGVNVVPNPDFLHFIPVRAVALQADGKILVGGAFNRIGGYARTNLARLHSDGSVDTAFNVAGGRYDGEGVFSVLTIVVQADDKILVGGYFSSLGGQIRWNLGRLNPDASVDPEFHPKVNSWVESAAVQRDGKIVIGGNFLQVGDQTRSRIARLNKDGSLDNSFQPALDGYSWLYSRVALQQDGRILVGGAVNPSGVSRNPLFRLNVDGSVDNTFAPPVNGPVFVFEVQADGKILVGGRFTTLAEQPRSNVGRLNPDGSLDATFNPGADSDVRALIQQPDGKILVGGWFGALGATNRCHLGRLYPDGGLDKTFNPDADGSVTSLAIQQDGRILVGGGFDELDAQSRDRLGRLTITGNLDSGNTIGADNYVRCIAVQTDGKVVIGGDFSTLGGEPRRFLGRMNPDGSLDQCFNPGANDSVTSLAVQVDEKVLVAGRFTMLGGNDRRYLGRINPDGSVDDTFAPTIDAGLYCVAIQPDGKVLLAGDKGLGGQSSPSLLRLNADGSTDVTFSASMDGSARCLAVQADGKILVGGSFTMLGGNQCTNIGRLIADGSLDVSFNPGANDTVNSLVVRVDGKVVVGGYFSILGGQSRRHIGLLNADGNVDATFQADANDVVWSLALQPDGKILVGSRATILAGQPRRAIARLSSTSVAMQTLLIEPSGTMVSWNRRGSGPEVEQVTFEQSIGGHNFATLGGGDRVNGGWQINGLSLPFGQSFYIRARGRYAGGQYNGSSSLIESVAQFYLIPPAHITSVGTTGDGAFQFAFTNTTGVSYTVLATTNVAEPSANWEVLGAPVSVGNGLYQFTDPGATNHVRRFYQLRSP